MWLLFAPTWTETFAGMVAKGSISANPLCQRLLVRASTLFSQLPALLDACARVLCWIAVLGRGCEIAVRGGAFCRKICGKWSGKCSGLPRFPVGSPLTASWAACACTWSTPPALWPRSTRLIWALTTCAPPHLTQKNGEKKIV